MVKQDRASHDVVSGTKVEPRSRAISPAAVNEMGVSYGTHLTDNRETSGGQSPLTTGPGLKAPMAGSSTSNKGSQGRY